MSAGIVDFTSRPFRGAVQPNSGTPVISSEKSGRQRTCVKVVLSRVLLSVSPETLTVAAAAVRSARYGRTTDPSMPRTVVQSALR